MFLRQDAILWHDGSFWYALDLTWSRHIGYAGPSLVQRKGSAEVLYADAEPDGSVHLYRPTVLSDPEHPSFRAKPGVRAGTATVAPEMMFDDATAAADPFAEHPE